MTKSELDSILGIGERTRELLWSNYNSIDIMKSVDIEELAEVIGRKKAEILKGHFLRSTI